MQSELVVSEMMVPGGGIEPPTHGFSIQAWHGENYRSVPPDAPKRPIGAQERP